MSKQSALPLSWPDRFGLDSFIIAESNKAAFDLVCHPEKWHNNILLLHGPDYSGKTHLAHIFIGLHKGILIDSKQPLDNAENDHIVIDSVDKILTAHPEYNEKLFHMVNDAMLGQKHVLLTMREVPDVWAKLPDLLSRLKAAHYIDLHQPDEDMIKAAYDKLFIDRGLIVDKKVLDFMAVRSQRNFADIQKNVRILDTLSLETGRKITIPMLQDTDLF